MAERPKTRRYPRIPAQHAVLVRPAETEESFARTTTLGLGGCAFVTPERFDAGNLVELLISVQDRVVNAVARVVYANPAGDGRQDVGVEFLQIEPHDRDFLRSLFGSDQGDA
jgi:PilZ domain-containing protein